MISAPAESAMPWDLFICKDTLLAVVDLLSHGICRIDIVTSLLSIVTLLLSIVASMLSHVHRRIAQPLGPP